MKVESRPAWSDRETFIQIYSQRSGYRVITIVSVLLLIMIAGCAGGAGVDASNTDTNDAGGDIAPSANKTEQQAMAEAGSTATVTAATTVIPQPETLDSTLHQLVITENQTTFAQQRGLDVRNDTVLVTIETDSDGELPTSITTDIKARSDNEILAYVAINDLIALARNDTIRTVRVPKTGNADTNQPNQHRQK